MLTVDMAVLRTPNTGLGRRNCDPKRHVTIQCTRAAKSGVFKWTISRRRRVIGDVIRLTRLNDSLRIGI